MEIKETEILALSNPIPINVVRQILDEMEYKHGMTWIEFLSIENDIINAQTIKYRQETLIEKKDRYLKKYKRKFGLIKGKQK